MYIPTTLLLPLLASVTAVVARPAAAPSPYKGDPVDSDDFIVVDGLRLRDGAGDLHYITGINYYACMNFAADSSTGGNYARLITELDQLAAKGVNHLRIMAASEGAPTTQPFRMNPPLLEAPGKYNEKIFAGLDTCLAEMQKRGMRATMVLNNEWQWTGGFGQYQSWSDNDFEIPYPPSWNLTAPPQRTVPGTGWGNYTVVDVDAFTYGNYTAYVNLFYNNTEAQDYFQDHIKTVVDRINTVNGRKYSEDATIMSWQLANEPQPSTVIDKGLGPFGLEFPESPNDEILPWIKNTSEYIHSIAPNHLVSVGFEGKQGKWFWQAVHNFSTIDYGTAHCWVQNWGVYGADNASLSNIEAAKDFAIEFVANTSSWAAEIGMPIVIEEFGMARDNWENVNDEYSYLSSASTSNRDAYFETVFTAVLKSFRDPKGAYVGTVPWAYSGIFRPETQKINEFGMVWAGDPPHEPSGWYGIYDTDETMDIIERQQQDAAAFVAEESG